MTDLVKKAGRGRPTKYKEEFCSMLIKHMAAGFSFESFAGIIDVNQETLHRWAKEKEEFSKAKATAFDKCRLFWEAIGIDAALGKSNPNASMWIFNMKNRFGWRDRIESTNVNVNPVNHTTLLDYIKGRDVDLLDGSVVEDDDNVIDVEIEN